MSPLWTFSTGLAVEALAHPVDHRKRSGRYDRRHVGGNSPLVHGNIVAARRLHSVWVSLVLLVACDGPAVAQRDYFISPRGTQIFSLSVQGVNGNQSFNGYQFIQGSSTHSLVSVVQYSRAVALGKRRAGLLTVLPGGSVWGSLNTMIGPLKQSNAGLGDFQFGGTLALAGPPVMNKEEYVEWKPGFAATAVMNVTAPTGQYASSQLFNLGSNRWIFTPSVVMVRYIGKSLIDPHLMTLELKPGVAFFTANHDSSGGGTTNQNPLFAIEGHVTKGLRKGLWASFDGYYKYGGSTQKDDGNPSKVTNAGRLGVALSYALPASWNIKAVYISNYFTSRDNSIERSLKLVFQRTF
jgi:hypothetical protein